MTRVERARALTTDERRIVVHALRAAARRVKGQGLGKGDQATLAARRRERYAEINNLAAEFERGGIA